MIPTFRAWHKELKQIYFVVSIDWISCTETIYPIVIYDKKLNEKIICEPQSLELMQWTGLKDAANNDAYEGDILCYDHGGGVETFVIERNPDDNQLHARYLYMSGYNTEYLGEPPVSGSLIVGNVYENSELLEE